MMLLWNNFFWSKVQSKPKLIFNSNSTLRLKSCKENPYQLQRRIQNAVKHLIFSFCENSWRLKSVNYFRKKLHLRYLTGCYTHLTYLKLFSNGNVKKTNGIAAVHNEFIFSIQNLWYTEELRMAYTEEVQLEYT